MNIDWNCEEAKGCDWVLVSVSNRIRFYKEEPKIESHGDWSKHPNFLGNPIADRWTLHERPKAEQMKETIYTKEMHERGETVGSGMTAIYKDKEVIIRLGCDTLRNVVFRLDGEWVTVNVDDIKPIDTRTDREKAIDDINYILMNEVAGKTTRQIAEHIVNKLEYLKFTGDK